MKKIWLTVSVIALGLSVGAVTCDGKVQNGEWLLNGNKEPGGWRVAFSFSAEGLAKEETLFEYPGVMKAVLRFAGTDAALRGQDVKRGNYLNFPLPDGRVPVIELTRAGSAVPLGVPLAVLEHPLGSHRVEARLGTDAMFSLLVDGVGYDEDGVRDKLVPTPVGAVATAVSPRVSGLELSTPAGAPLVAEPYTKRITRSIQFWTPDGHNAWVGDVVVGMFKERFHIFYLLDRRHHSSKGGTGGHYFAHLSSADLVSWDDHGKTIPNDAWWKTQGTGTPFVRDGKFHLAYGLHTSRLTKETCSAAYWQDFKTNGTMRTFKFGELPGYPAGATTASSADGIHFTPTETLIHPSENPTVYTRSDGRLGLVSSYGVAWDQRGLYVSDSIGDWTLFDRNVPFLGDCPCFFDWHGRHYLLQGFTRMAYNADGRVGGWTDWSQTGDDIYDGLSVPMVAAWPGNRRILAAWLSHPQGWGGWLVLRELVWNDDGTLGLKWLPEVTPPGDIYEYAGSAGHDLVVRIPRQDGGKELEFRVEAATGRAQFADAEVGAKAARQKTQAELNREGDKGGMISPSKGFAIQNVRGLDRPYRVRLNVYRDAKSGCTIFDAEVAGRRTLVCYREGRYLKPVADSGK